MGFTIRQASEEYASSITDIGSRVFRETFGAVSPPQELENYLKESYTPQVQLREIRDPNMYTFLAFNEENMPVGFCQLRDKRKVYDFVGDPEAIELQRIYIDKSATGKGVGGLLIKQAIAKARELGKKTIWLGVWEENVPALALYKKHGFYKVGTHVFKLAEKDDVDDVYILKLD